MDIANNYHKQYKITKFVYSCQYHIVFCPKFRRPVLTPPIDVRFKELVLEKQKEHEYKVLEMEVMPHYVHLFLDLNPQIGVYNVIGKIKDYTAATLRKEFPSLKTRLPTLWTRSKLISTVGIISLEVIQKYIEDQKGR